MTRNYYSRAGVCALSLLGFALTAPAGAQSVWYVDSGAPAGGNGTSWSAPFRYLQDALSVAISGDEIRMGHGMYKPDHADHSNVVPGDRTATFNLRPGVALHGGYAGYGAANPNLRDLSAYESILNGDLAGDDGLNFTNMGDNSFHVLVGRGLGFDTVLDGLTVRGGTGSDPNDPNYPNVGGGAMLINASPTVISCTFRENAAVSAGGAMFISGADPTVSGCLFAGNRANTGGAIECRNAATPILDNSQFSGNTAFDGGAIRHLGPGAPNINRCKFDNNAATGNGGAVFVRNNSTALISWCTFRDNTANTGGALSIRTSGPHVSDCEFSGNVATRSGGAVQSAQHSYAVITDSALLGNHATSGGGLFNSDDSSPGLTNCTFEQNVAAVDGGGLCATSTSVFAVVNCAFSSNVGNWGGGLCSRGGSPQVTNCTFTANSGAYGGGFYSSGGATPFFDGSTLSGNFAYDGAGYYNEGGATPTLSNVLFADNAASHTGGAFFSTDFCSPALLTCAFRGNSAAALGGALCCLNGSSPALIGGRFVDNVSHAAGGALHLDADAGADVIDILFIGNTAATTGGAVNLGPAGRFVGTNCIFDGNLASSNAGGALYGDAGAVAGLYDCTLTANHAVTTGGINAPGADLRLFNSILWGNSDQAGSGESAQVFAGDTPVLVHYCDVQGWTGDLGGTGNFGVDPRFSSPAGTDGIPGTEDDDLRLDSGSPCVDAGDNTAVPADEFDLNRNGNTDEPLPFDLSGGPRFVDDPATPDSGAGTPPLVDLGAYERQVPTLLGDMNCDGVVTFDDINPFVLALSDPVAYQDQYPNCDIRNADCNGDGQVNFDDIPAFVAILSGG